MLQQTHSVNIWDAQQLIQKIEYTENFPSLFEEEFVSYNYEEKWIQNLKFTFV